MSTLETILSRMMHEPAFADAILADSDEALAEYGLSDDELARFRDLSRAGFDAFASSSPEERKSLVSAGIGRLLSTDGGRTW